MKTKYVESEEEMITISKEKYNELIRDSEFLNCLESCGVDNWEGYSDACQMMNKNTESEDEE